MKALLATSNPHKLDEIQAVIPDGTLDLVTLDWLTREYQDSFVEPEENANTFEGNAMIKARSYAKQSGWVTVADDSGLVVDALYFEPGVRSARYAGVKGPREEVDLANNRKLLEKLDGVPIKQRTARFVCIMTVAWPEGHERYERPLWARGEVNGRILLPEEADDRMHPEQGRGDQGFGYDPLFVLPADHPDFPGTTAAELTPDQKNAISHRGQAARKLVQMLTEEGLIEDVPTG